MARLDGKKGRFTVDYDTNEVYQALAGYQSTSGDEITYFRYDSVNSQVDDIYGEGTGVGKKYIATVMPVEHATHDEGGNQNTPEGFYTNDALTITASYDQLRRAGLSRLDIMTSNYLKDRVVYDQKVFRIEAIHVVGQVQERDIMVGMDCTQVKPDELVDDVQFAQYSA